MSELGKMAKEFNKSQVKEPMEEKKKQRPIKVSSDSGAIYGLGIIGVAVYYIQHATSFWLGVIGIIKAFFWPAIVVYKVFEMLKL